MLLQQNNINGHQIKNFSPMLMLSKDHLFLGGKKNLTSDNGSVLQDLD
jgi:hypothetical protein